MIAERTVFLQVVPTTDLRKTITVMNGAVNLGVRKITILINMVNRSIKASESLQKDQLT